MNKKIKKVFDEYEIVLFKEGTGAATIFAFNSLSLDEFNQFNDYLEERNRIDFANFSEN